MSGAGGLGDWGREASLALRLMTSLGSVETGEQSLSYRRRHAQSSLAHTDKHGAFMATA